MDVADEANKAGKGLIKKKKSENFINHGWQCVENCKPCPAYQLK